MTASRGRNVAILIGGLVLISVIAWETYDHFDDRSVAASILNIPALPSSIGGVECEGWGFTDYVATCAFELDPNDFSRLLTGRPFEPLPPHPVTAHDFGGGPQVGPDFQVGTRFVARPVEFVHGGHVLLAADREHRHALVDIYIE